MLTKIKSFLKSDRASTTRQPAHRLGLDPLDERLVPTVVFRPHFGAETVAPGSTNDALSSPSLQLIFAGSYWNTADGAAARDKMIAATKSMVNSPYLSAIAQYGGDGKATYGTAWTETTGLANGFTGANLQALLQRVISNPNSPTPYPTNTTNPPIYIVITPPGVGNDHGDGGYNWRATYKWADGHTSTIHTEWIHSTTAADGKVNMDEFGSVMSHELIETMSDPDGRGIHVNAPSGLPANLKGDNQIGDNEAAAVRYGYRLNGVMVQPYWSVRDNAFVVPDGNRQNFYVDPVWAGATGSQWFTGKYDLSVQGDQLGANYNDAITAGGLANSSTTTTMNGETATFDAGKIRTLNIDTRGGSNAVNVNFSEAGETVNVTSNGGLGGSTIGLSHDTVNVGGGYLSNIAGTVNVSNSSGTTAVVADDSKDATGRTVHYTDHSINFAGFAAVNYNAGSVLSDGSRRGVNAASFSLGTGKDTVFVDGVNNLATAFAFAQAPDIFTGAAVGRLTRINH